MTFRHAVAVTAIALFSFTLGCEPRPAPAAAASTNDQRLVQVTLFVPALERDGTTPVDQERWTNESLEFFGKTFGGATALPRGRGIWRDDAHGGRLVFEDTVVVVAWIGAKDLAAHRADLDAFCRRMARDAKQDEVGVILGDRYAGFTPSPGS